MENLFFTVLGMSGTASVVILVVVLARLVLRRAPKVFSYALWTVVLFRLLCPFTFRSPWGVVVPVRVEPIEEKKLSVETSTAEVTIHVGGTVSAWEPVLEEDLPPVASFVPAKAPDTLGVPDSAAPVTAAPAAPDWRTIAGALWLTGVLLLLGYSAVSLFLLRRRLIGSVPLNEKKDVWLADHIPSPFVLGLVRPRIYLPSDLPEHERDYILLHERTHIRRFDHITRALAWIALSIHWFNPLVWLAFHLAGKDMELSCDEAVLRKMDRDIRADYSSSLLRLSVGGRFPAGPLAFGGGDVQKRIINVLNYKQPAFWVGAVALIAVLCTGVALATNQSGLFIDPDSVISVTSFDASSRTITPQNTGVYTTDDLWKDLLDPVNPQVLSREDGLELVRLINSHRKTVYEHGELTLSGWEHHLKRIDCADGSFYVMDYWYWNGFSLNPFHMGEDDYTTLVTYYDAEGNAGTTWQMEYDFDRAYVEWAQACLNREKNPSTLSLEELADSLNADLTFTLDQSQLDGSPFVRISGTVGGVTLSRAVWNPEEGDSLLGEHPGGELTMEYVFESGGATLGAWWTDDTHTSITISSKITTYYSSYIPNGWWEFTVDLATGAITAMVSHPMESTLPDPVKLYPESITDGEAVPVARMMAVVMWAAEDYYTRSSPETPALAVTYSMNESMKNPYFVDVNGLDCDEAIWHANANATSMAGVLELPEHGMLGLLSITNPRFFGGRFAEAQGLAIVGYFPNDGAPLVFVGFDDYDYLPTDSYSGWKRGDTGSCFVVDLASGAVRVPPSPSPEYESLDSGLSDEEAVSLAKALAQIIQGAVDFYERSPNTIRPAPYEDQEDEMCVLLDNGHVLIRRTGNAIVEWSPSSDPDGPGSIYFAGDPGFCCIPLAGRTAEGGANWRDKDQTMFDVTFNVNDERVTSGTVFGYRIAFAVDLNRRTVIERDFKSFVEGETLELTNQEMIDIAHSLDALMKEAQYFYSQTSGQAAGSPAPASASPAPASAPQPTAPAPSGTPETPYVPAPAMPGNLIYSNSYGKATNEFPGGDFDAVPGGGNHIRVWYKNLTDKLVWVYLRRDDLPEANEENLYAKVVVSFPLAGNAEGFQDYVTDDADAGTYRVWIQSQAPEGAVVEGGTYVSQY